MNNLDTFGKRLAHARKTRKLTQREVAKKAGIEQGTLSGLETEKSPSTASAVPLARALRVRIEWLIDGEGDMDLDAYIPTVDTSTSITQFDENVEPTTLRKPVPLISWVQAGELSEIVDFYSAGEADRWVNPVNCKPSKSAFALTVQGDSMTWDGTPNFPEGTVLIVDPERSPTAGDYVIAKDTNTQKATFKKLITDDVHFFLKPLNPSPIYETKKIDDPQLRVIGVVIEYQFIGRL